MGHKVKLTYFTSYGKFKYEGEYTTEQEMMFHIAKEVQEMQQAGTLPGILPGNRHDNYIVHIDVPGHPNYYPILIIAPHFQTAMSEAK